MNFCDSHFRKDCKAENDMEDPLECVSKTLSPSTNKKPRNWSSDDEEENLLTNDEEHDENKNKFNGIKLKSNIAVDTVIEYFQLFFPIDLIEHILQLTNEKIDNSHKKINNITQDELIVFIGVTVSRMFINSTTHELWSNDPIVSNTYIKNFLSRERYNNIITFLTLINMKEEEKLKKVTNLMILIRKWAERVFEITNDIPIDDPYKALRGECKFIDNRCKIKSRKPCLCLFYYLTDQAIIKALTLYKIDKGLISGRSFCLKLAQQLFDFSGSQRKHMPPAPSISKLNTHFIIKGKFRRRCRQCKKRVVYCCKQCNISLCIACFPIFHHYI
ncbi:hypothetical protein SNEBB_003557 [Seison nebaliae]|nr:hypothetical protein SNEBB_003557 [Seison nebaliae]